MASTTTTVRLISADNQTFEIERTVVEKAITIKNLLEDLQDDDVTEVPLPATHSRELSAVLEYMNYFKNHDASDVTRDANADDIFRKGFMDKLSRDETFALVIAANYLNYDQLLQDVCKKIAYSIKGKTTEEMRIALNIENDLTPEEEEQIRSENAWAFD